MSSRNQGYDTAESRRSPRDRSPGRYNDPRDTDQYRGGAFRGGGERRRSIPDARSNHNAFASNRELFTEPTRRESARDFPSREPPRGPKVGHVGPKVLLDAPTGPRASTYSEFRGDSGFRGDFRGRGGRGRGRGWRDDSRDRGRDADREYRDRDRRDERGPPPFRDDRSRDRERWERDSFRGRRASSPQGRGRSPNYGTRDARDGPPSLDLDRTHRNPRDAPLSTVSPGSDINQPFVRGYGRARGGRGRGRGAYYDDYHRPASVRSRSPEPIFTRRPVQSTTPPPQPPQVPAFGSTSVKASTPVTSTYPSIPYTASAGALNSANVSSLPASIPTGPRVGGLGPPRQNINLGGGGKQNSSWAKPYDRPSPEMREVFGRENELFPNHARYDGSAQDNLSMNGSVNEDNSHSSNIQTRPNNERPIELFPDRHEMVTKKRHPSLGRRHPKVLSPAPEESDIESDSDSADELGDPYFEESIAKLQEGIKGEKKRNPLLPPQTPIAASDWHSLIVPIIDNTADETCEAPITHQESKSEQPKEVSPPISAPVPISKAESPLVTTVLVEIPKKEPDVVAESTPKAPSPKEPTPAPAPIGQVPEEVEKSSVAELPVEKEKSPVMKSLVETAPTENIPIEENSTVKDAPAEQTPIVEPPVEEAPSENIIAGKVEVPPTQSEVPIASSTSDTHDMEMVDEVAQEPPAIQVVIESAIRERNLDANNEPAQEPLAISEPNDLRISPKVNGVHLPSGPTVDHNEKTKPSTPSDKDQDVEMTNGHSAMDLDEVEEQLHDQLTTNGTDISPRIDQFEESEGSITAREKEDELEAVRRMMKTPPLNSLPKSTVTCFWNNPDLVAELEIRNFKVEAEVRKHVQETKARRMMDQESEGRAWAKRYYEYRKFTDFSMDPVAIRSREKFSASRARAEAEAAAPSSSSIASANSKPEGRRTGRWATEHDFERVLRESELEAKEKKDQDERLARAKTASAKEATIPAMMDGQWWLENGFVDKSHLVPFNRSFALLEYGEPVDNFTPEESEIFEKVYLETPKNWSNVAEALSTRDFKACIQHYYLVKHSSKLKDKSKGGKGKGKGKGGRKPTRPKTTVLSARLGNGDDADETPDTENGESKRRPRRAAAPVFPIDIPPNETETSTPAPTPSRKANATLKTEPGSESGPAKKKVKVAREKASKQGKNNQLLAAAPPIASADRRDGSPATPVPEPKSSRGSTGPNRFPIQFDGPTQPQPQSIQPQPAIVPQFVPGGRPANIEPLAEFGPQNKPPPTLQSMPQQQSQPPPKAPVTSQPQPYPSQERVNSTTPLSFDAQQDRRSIQQTSSYWSVPEQNDFAQLLDYYGTDWQAIAKYMTTKTHIMVYTDLFQQWLAVPSDSNKSRRVANIQAQVKNYYQRQVDSGKRHWADITRDADARKERGETLPPLPSPTIIPKRRYDERSGTLPGPSSHPSRTGSALDGMDDMASPGPSSMLPRSSQASPSQPGPSLSARFPALANAGPVPHIQPATPASIISKQVTPQPAQQTPPIQQNIRPRGPPLGYFVTETQQRPPLQGASSDSNLSQRSLQVAKEAQIERQSALRLEQEQQQREQKQREQKQREQQIREQQLYLQQRQELEQEKHQAELQQKQQRQREELQRSQEPQRPREQQLREQQERELQIYQQQQQYRQEQLEHPGRQREHQKQQQQHREEQQRRDREQELERERAIAIEREKQETHNYQMKLKKESTNDHPSLQGYEPYSTTSMRNSNVIAHSRGEVPQQVPERREPPFQPVRSQQTPRAFGSDKPPTGPREIREREMKPSPSPALPRQPPTGPSMRNEPMRHEPMRNEAMRNDMYSTPPAQPKPPTQPQHHHQPPLQTPQVSAVRQQETVRKTSNIMSLLNDDEPSDPRPEPPKRVSNVVSTPQPSHTPPPQHPLQANRFASHQPASQPPPQMQQVPTHSQHNSQHHLSHSPHPYSHASPHPMHQHTSSIGHNRSYTPTSLDRRGYEPPPQQHTPQQTPLFSQPSSRQSMPAQPAVRRELSHGEVHGLAGGYSRGGPAQSAMRLKESPYSSTPPPAATQSVRPPATSPHDLAQPSERDFYARQPSQAQYIMQQQQQPAAASPQLTPSYQPPSQQPPNHRQLAFGQRDSHMASPPSHFAQQQLNQRSRHNSFDARSQAYGAGSASSGSTPSHSGYPPQAPHQPAHPTMQYQHPARQERYPENSYEREMQIREQQIERRLQEEQAQAQYHQRLRDDGRDRR